jgi:hypothetical protein
MICTEQVVWPTLSMHLLVRSPMRLQEPLQLQLLIVSPCSYLTQSTSLRYSTETMAKYAATRYGLSRCGHDTSQTFTLFTSRGHAIPLM